MSETEKIEARRLLLARLLYPARPTIDPRALADALTRTDDRLELAWSEGEQFSVAHHGHTTEPRDGRPVPLMTAGFVSATEAPDLDLSQAWFADDGLREAAIAARGEVMLAEMFAFSHSPAERVEEFGKVVSTLVQETDPAAVWLPLTGQLLSPADAVGNPARLAFNVRLFNVTGTDETVMDCLGLDVLGLPEPQCHFLDLAPGDVAAVLMSLGEYLIAEGDVIDDGDTVDGHAPGETWRAQHEDSLVAPERAVLDLDPGDPYAAGTRER